MWLVYGETKLQITLVWYRRDEEFIEVEWQYLCQGKVQITPQSGENCLRVSFAEGVVVDIAVEQCGSMQGRFFFLAPPEVKLYQHGEAEDKGIAIPAISNS